MTLRSQAPGEKQSNSSAIEVGNAIPVGGGFAVGVLQSGQNSRAGLSWMGASGQQQHVDLGVVHGPVEPPRVAPFLDDIIVGVSDNDAGHTRVRLAQVAGIKKSSEVKWGPEFLASHGDTNSFSLAVFPGNKNEGSARAGVAWDDFDKQSLRSRIKFALFSPATMKQLARERVISPSDDDAVSPTLVPREGGFWIVWVSYGPLSEAAKAPAADGQNLVGEPPSRLRVQKLDEQGLFQGEPLTISAEMGQVLVYEAAPYSIDSLAVAFRLAASGRLDDEVPVQTRLVRGDGSIVEGICSHEHLGFGAPTLLDDSGASHPWLSARGTADTEVLLGSLDGDGGCADLGPDPGLSGAIPLARAGETLLSMSPDGLNLKLEISQCQLAPDGK